MTRIGNGDFVLADSFHYMKDMPNESIDMLICDPPYGMSYVSGWRKVAYNKIINDDQLTWLDDFAEDCYRILKNDTASYIFCSFHNIDLFKQAFEKRFKVKNILVWVKNNHSSGDLKHDFAPKVEFILFLQKGKRRINGKRDANVLYAARTGNKLHPTEKPVVLFDYLIRKFSDPNDTVFDPFAGSGTTAVAAESCGRNWVCIEKDESYYHSACKRVKEYVAQGEALFG